MRIKHPAPSPRLQHSMQRRQEPSHAQYLYCSSPSRRARAACHGVGAGGGSTSAASVERSQLAGSATFAIMLPSMSPLSPGASRFSLPQREPPFLRAAEGARRSGRGAGRPRTGAGGSRCGQPPCTRQHVASMQLFRAVCSCSRGARSAGRRGTNPRGRERDCRRRWHAWNAEFVVLKCRKRCKRDQRPEVRAATNGRQRGGAASRPAG